MILGNNFNFKSRIMVLDKVYGLWYFLFILVIFKICKCYLDLRIKNWEVRNMFFKIVNFYLNIVIC